MIWALLLILAAALLVYAVVAGAATKPARRLGQRGRLDKEMVSSRWETINQMAAGGGNGLKTAVSEADKLLDYVMKQTGFPGQTMGERLKSGRSRQFSDLNSIWRAHKLRNALAHEMGFDLVKSQADEALRDFERGLKDLGAL